MKLTVILLTVAILNVSAKGLSQMVSFTGKNASLKQVLSVIKKQTGFSAAYNEMLLDKAKPITLRVSNIPLNAFLQLVFQDQPMVYSIENTTIIISEKPPVLNEAPVRDNSLVFVPPLPVRGLVTDAEGKPLAGATITIKGGKEPVITSAEGLFNLNVSEGDIVSVSYVGYLDLTFKIGIKQPGGAIKAVVLSAEQASGATGDGSASYLINTPGTGIAFTISLKPKDVALTDVVVNKGYYTEKKAVSTGDVTTVTGEDIRKQPVDNPLMALEGRVPGLVVSQISGIPGSDMNVRIRGQNSLSQGSSPLYIIDGVPFGQLPLPTDIGSQILPNGATSPFGSINPSDIESIEVLKDADATAIYGSRGSNGVILITTRKGKAGSTKLDINVYTGVGAVTRKPKLMNTREYLAMRREALKNDGITPTNANAADILLWDTTRQTDWVNYFMGRHSNTSDAQVRLSGGSASTQFAFGGGFHNQNTIFPFSKPDNRGSVNFSADHHSANNRFTASISTMYSINKNNLPSRDLSRSAYQAPNTPALFDSLGRLVWSKNGGAIANPMSYALQTYSALTKNLISNAVFQYKLIDGLNLKTSLGYTDMEFNEKLLVPQSSLNPANAASVSNSTFGNYSTGNWIIEPQADYSRQFGKGKLDVLAGGTWQETNGGGLAIKATKFINDNLLNDPTSAASVATDPYYQGGKILYHYEALYGRINYNFDNKYLLNLTGRRDGSSRFGPGKQFANFGAIGAAWIFTEEEFARKALSFLNFGKLRGSYGTTGNDQIGDYQYLDTWGPSGSYAYQAVNSIAPLRLYNSNYAWEINHKLELALELGFAKDRIVLSTDFFRNRTGNQLINYTLADQAGFSSVLENFPAVVQNTGLEFDVKTVNIKGRALTWKTYFNLTIPRNKLVSFPGLDSSSYFYSYTIGKSISSYKLLHSTGVDPTTGVYTFSGHGLYPNDAISTFDFSPKFYGGIGNNFRYKGIELDFLFQFVRQLGNFISMIQQIPGVARFNQPVQLLDRWQKPGDHAAYQRYTTSLYLISSLEYTGTSDGGVSDDSYIRLKNVSLSYTLPGEWARKMKIASLRIYIQGQNLLTLTHGKYKNYDPENNTALNYLPPLKIITGGLQFTF